MIHRDLKPANIKVKADGMVKVLDFGLAKAFEPEAGSVSASMSPTISLTAAATQMGMVIGTAAYMAPEQAKGLAVDKRADIWAYGAVLFEMLTGKKLFEAGDVSEMLASVLVKDPDISSIGQHVPDHIRSVVRHCLVKDPKERLRDIGDVRLAMKGTFETTVSVPTTQFVSSQPAAWRRQTLPWVAGLLLAAVTGVGVGMMLGPAPQTPRITRSTMELPTGVQPSGPGRRVALSADGRTLVFSGVDAETPPQLYVRQMDRFGTTALRDTDGALAPFFSPDGVWVGFSMGGNELVKVSLQGGPAQTVTAVPTQIRGGSWGRDDRIILGTLAGLYEVSGAGGEPQALTSLDTGAGETGHLYPNILPGGLAVLFTSESGELNIELFRLDTGERRLLVENGVHPHYVTSGHIVFGRDDSIWAVPFDVERLEMTGEPFPLVEDVQNLRGLGGTQFSASRDGRLVYLTGDPFGGEARTLVWVDRNGLEEPIPIDPRVYAYPRVSPDGDTIALSETQPYDIWSWSVTRQTRSRLTFDDGLDAYPTWSPDGRTLVFVSSREGVQNLFRRPADGTGSVERITDAPNPQRPHAISPDGTWVVLGEISPETGMDLFRLSLENESSTAEVLVQTEFEEWNADISPDGNWLAYESNASGQFDVLVRPFPDAERGLQQVSTGGGRMPRWSPDGRELFYWAPEGGMMAVQVDVGSSLILGAPEVLFDGPYYSGGGVTVGRTYDVAPDGRRFLMVKRAIDVGQAAGVTEQRLRLVQNWFQELTERVPLP